MTTRKCNINPQLCKHNTLPPRESWGLLKIYQEHFKLCLERFLFNSLFLSQAFLMMTLLLLLSLLLFLVPNFCQISSLIPHQKEQLSFFHNLTVEIVLSEQWSSKVAWFLKEHYCPSRNHTTVHDHVLLVTFSTVNSGQKMALW